MIKKLKIPELKVKNLVVLLRLSDGTIRQAVINEFGQACVLNALNKASRTGKVMASEDVVDGIDWKSEVDLTEKKTVEDTAIPKSATFKRII